MTDKWQLQKCPKGEFTCDNSIKSAEDIPELLKVLEKKFSVKYDDKGTVGPDGVYFSVTIGEEQATIGWDIWSGVFIMPKDIKGNYVIEAVYEYLSGQEKGEHK